MKQIEQATILFFRGAALFFSRPRYWPYALIPFLLLLAFYIGVFVAVSGWLVPAINGLLPDGGDSAFMQFLYTCLRALIAFTLWTSVVFFAVTTIASFYEIVSAVFLDPMVRRIRKDCFGLDAAPLTLRHECRLAAQSGLYALGTLLITLGILCISFIPVLPILLHFAFVWPRLSITWMLPATFADGLDISELKVRFKHRQTSLRTLGGWFTLILLIPFVGPFFFPVFATAATLLYHAKEECEKETP